MRSGKTPKEPKPVADLEQLHFYFDAVERDRIDTCGFSRKSGEVLALRDKLLTMPEGEFDSAIKTLKRLVADVRKSGDSAKEKAKEAARQRRQASLLFDQVNEASKAVGGANAPAQKVSVV
jgi:hypothetical protein